MHDLDRRVGCNEREEPNGFAAANLSFQEHCGFMHHQVGRNKTDVIPVVFAVLVHDQMMELIVFINTGKPGGGINEDINFIHKDIYRG